ncbi:hypothetical protein C5167_043617 [Papaver somniferum]|uniref:DNA 5'-3' helicase n=1 Tax=Papaver somniferum TaxID=3469 RepID=A0A4Y7LA24_PAPSO|nr:hypothetical protein C5167_043617 [Papaver somniferum]
MQIEYVVVFDEVHNIDNACIEALSVSVRQQTLEGDTRNLSKIAHEIDRFKAADANAQRGCTRKHSKSRTSSKCIAKISTLRGHLQSENVIKEEPTAFVASIYPQSGIDQKLLRFCYVRLHSLMMTLKITDTDEFQHIQTVCAFATLVGTYTRGLSIVIEPFDERMPHIDDHVLQLSCHDASVAKKPVLDRPQSVVITSGTESYWSLPLSSEFQSRYNAADSGCCGDYIGSENYRRACDCGRDAVFFSVARGKVAEAQCVGRVIRSEADNGMMIFADKRYSRHEKRSKLPGWVLSHLCEAHLNVSTYMALHIGSEFLRKMSQTYDKTGVECKSTLLSDEDLKKMTRELSQKRHRVSIVSPWNPCGFGLVYIGGGTGLGGLGFSL